jgi:hypothetical protein
MIRLNIGVIITYYGIDAKREGNNNPQMTE